ncbi:hypothetical protein K439DRAFT_702491 [Ramaria rubella]|nr:hypothetical protein K439DRAFT_702491 [Ramaria rubella]
MLLRYITEPHCSLSQGNSAVRYARGTAACTLSDGCGPTLLPEVQRSESRLGFQGFHPTKKYYEDHSLIRVLLEGLSYAESLRVSSTPMVRADVTTFIDNSDPAIKAVYGSWVHSSSSRSYNGAETLTWDPGPQRHRIPADMTIIQHAFTPSSWAAHAAQLI